MRTERPHRVELALYALTDGIAPDLRFRICGEPKLIGRLVFIECLPPASIAAAAPDLIVETINKHLRGSGVKAEKVMPIGDRFMILITMTLKVGPRARRGRPREDALAARIIELKKTLSYPKVAKQINKEFCRHDLTADHVRYYCKKRRPNPTRN